MDESVCPPGRVVLTKPQRDTAWLELLQRAAGGEEIALASLYDETSGMVYGLALRMLGNVEDAEEVTLDVYKQIWRTASSFDASRGSAAAWIMTLARTRALDKLRSRSSRDRGVEPLPAHFEAADGCASPEEESFASERRRIVLAALAELPEEQRRALELAYFHGMTHSELAQMLGEPLGTVKTRIRLGMLKLRELLRIAGPVSREVGA